MAILYVSVKDFLVFKGKFTADFGTGVNVLIGGNGTGKTTLIKFLYYWCIDNQYYLDWEPNFTYQVCSTGTKYGLQDASTVKPEDMERSGVYIPEKDILEHAKGLLPFIEQKQTGFGRIYKDVLIAALDIPTQKQSEMQKSVGQKISGIIGGDVHWDEGNGAFYTQRTDGSRIPFINEASGYKKLGFLGLLVSSGRLCPGTILFWDEPENSLNPELIPILVDILLELSRNGVQIFIATHSEIFASYFSVNRQDRDNVMFTSLYKDGEQIKANTSDRFDLLEPNNLTAEPVKLYEKEIEKGLGTNG